MLCVAGPVSLHTSLVSHLRPALLSHTPAMDCSRTRIDLCARRFEWSNALLVTFASQALGIDCKTAAHKERLRDLRVLNTTALASRWQRRVLHTPKNADAHSRQPVTSDMRRRGRRSMEGSMARF